MRVSFSKSCLKALRKLPTDELVQIALRLGRYAESAEAVVDIKALKGEDNVFRLRHGDYRAVFEIRESEMHIIRIAHRKDVYED